MSTLSPIEVEDPKLATWLGAYDILEIEAFLARALPPHWGGIRARIVETGVTMSEAPCGWAPRWTQVPPTQRVGRCDDESRMRSIIYRVHDCLHQLWGLPHPGDLESDDDRVDYKRAQMCGEIAVLTLTEFVFGKWLHDSFPELRRWIEGRCAVRMLQNALSGKTTTQVAMRLDEFLHQRHIRRWVANDEDAKAFADYYQPMMQRDREMIDACWEAMKAEPGWAERNLHAAPKARFANTLNGIELTCWMIEDFEHLLWTSPEPDSALTEFNRARRANIRLPKGWPGT